MRRIVLLGFVLQTLLTTSAFAGGGGGRPARFEWKDSNVTKEATRFVESVAAKKLSEAYQMGGEKLRKSRTLDAFSADMNRARLAQSGTVAWESGNNALQAGNGFKLMGTFTPSEGEPFSVYIHLEGDAHVAPKERNRQWNEKTKWTVLDYRSAESFVTRVLNDRASGLDWFLAIAGLIYILAVLGLLFSYIPGLRGHPRELWLMFFTKLTEYSAYGAASAIFILFLQKEVMLNGESLGDSLGYQYYLVWGIVATIITMMVGAVCDTIGVKKCLLIGAVMLLISRFFTPLTTDIIPVTLLGFLPLAFGFAITGPVLKVGIKWFTTLKSATLGFGLFYTLMNIGFTVGALIADYFRKNYADGLDVLGVEFTAYQAIIAVGFLINIPDFIAILMMREGAEMTENGVVIKKADHENDELVVNMLKSNFQERRAKMVAELLKSCLWTLGFAAIAYVFYEFEIHAWKVSVVKVGSYMWAFAISIGLFAIGGVLYACSSYVGTIKPGGFFDRVMKSVRDSTEGTVAHLKENFSTKPFWIYMAMLGILTFVKLAFYIFHVMFQPYAIRVFGDDFPIASLFGTLNPAMIVLLVPLVSWATVKISSYTMLMVGTALSAASVFLCFLPTDLAIWIGDTWFGSAIYDYWVEAPVGARDPFLISLIIFIIVFTIGEAIWSPRLMQFSAEIAPRGKEGAYISLAVLPYFFGKIAATVMADILTSEYFSESMVEYPDHELSWLWIAGMCLLSPLGMIIFRGAFNQSQKMADDEAAATKLLEGGQNS